MATFFGEIIEPSTRALFDDCSDEESDVKSFLQILWKDGYEYGPENIETFLVVHGALTLAFAEAYLLDSEHIQIGAIHYNSSLDSIKPHSKREDSSSPLILQGNLLAAFIHPLFPAESAFDFADLVAPYLQKAKNVVILTSQSNSKYKSLPGEIPPANAVYSLLTSAVKTAPVRPYPSEANILTGVPAGVASWCEINGVPASLFISYNDSQILDSLTAHQLLGILPQKQNNPDLKRRWVYGGGGRPTDSLSNMYM